MAPVDPLQSFRLDGKVAIVTGASSGLGERFARVLDAAGANVVLTARRAERLEALARDLRDPLAVACDLTDDAHRSELVPRVVEHFGHVDVLVNNAGSSEPMRALDEPLDHFRATIETNLVASFAVAQDVARALVDADRPGVIVNVASIYGVTGVGRVPEAGYAASKGGIVSLTRELAAQWSRKRIRVNALAPGYFPSEMTADLFADPRLVDWVQEKTPLSRAGEPHELDGALLFLASDASSYVTGQVLCVDGGWTAI
ncbi:MAG: glucose 1-dehydrogenase [Actinobacteria bacterium]|nr:glucose 1-dehydrogenase [Actinomycetota bacterium]